MDLYTQLQLREVFHLEFLRWLTGLVKSEHYALKGGVNLRFFYNSFRYSEDMDLDVCGIRKDILLDTVIGILKSPSFQNTLRTFGIERVISPDTTKAKQTETTQRFKVHLIISSGEDLFTKVEFSRRGFNGTIAAGSVSDNIVRAYKLPPLIVPHYDITSVVKQKIEALHARNITQARDIFDLYILSSQYSYLKEKPLQTSSSKLKKAHEKIFDISFEQFRDTVAAYFSDQERNTYDNPAVWDEVKLKTAAFLEELGKKND